MSGLCEKTNSIYIVFYLLYTTMSKWSECAHASGVCARALAHAAFTRGVNAWRRACLKCGADATFQAPTEASANQIASCKYPIPFMQHQRSMWLVVVTMTARQHHASDTPSVKRWRRRPVWMQREPERAHTHVTHRMRVRTQITWTWLCTRGKKRYKYCSFSHTNRSFRVLGHQCVVTMGNCLIWISLCMFFFPLIETVTYTCHYMTDRLERFDLKTSKLDLLKKKRHLRLGCPWGKLIDTTF